MIASRCRVHFVGGPSDGLVLDHPLGSVDGKLSLSPSQIDASHGPTKTGSRIGNWQPAYRLTLKRRTHQDGLAITDLRYDFLGYEQPRPSQQALQNKQKSGWRVALESWCARTASRWVQWMLEPVAYPLQINRAPHPRRARKIESKLRS